jgi:hypothetical protein
MTESASDSHAFEGIALHSSTLESAQLASWTALIEAGYSKAEEARSRGGMSAVNQMLQSGQRFVATASSLTLGAALPESEIKVLLAAVGNGRAGAWVRRELGKGIVCDLDQAWVRRQYAPGHYPALHRPHGWHQDGALGFDFLSSANATIPAEALLPMVTCWIALDPCGTEAPGLELVRRRLEGLLPPVELTDERIRRRFGQAEFWQPAMEAGDALLLRGDILHRTHVTSAMTRNRTSLELRFFPATGLPARLKGDRFLPLD